VRTFVRPIAGLPAFTRAAAFTFDASHFFALVIHFGPQSMLVLPRVSATVWDQCRPFRSKGCKPNKLR
jgi:hypothetical protein